MNKSIADWLKDPQVKRHDFQIYYYHTRMGKGWRYANYYSDDSDDDSDDEDRMIDEDWYSCYNDGTAYDDWYWYPDNSTLLYGGTRKGDGDDDDDDDNTLPEVPKKPPPAIPLVPAPAVSVEANDDVEALIENIDLDEKDGEIVERVMAGLENGGKKDIEEEKAEEGEEIEEEKADDKIKPDWQGVHADDAVTLVVFNKWDKYFTNAIKQHSVPITKYEQCSSAFDHIRFLAGLFDKEHPTGHLVFEGVSAFN